MTTETRTKIQAQADIGYETSKFALAAGIAMAAAVGLWGAACLLSAMVTSGPLHVLKNYFIAMIGG